MCPDKRVTREIGTKRSLKLWPLACIIDECQNLFGHEKYGKQAGEDAVFIIKIGPAFGVMLDLATQRPDAKSLPTGVSSNVGLRFCLKVMDQMANDMVLGTSAYKNGIRATTFRRRGRRRARLPRRRALVAAGRPHLLPEPARHRAGRQARPGAPRSRGHAVRRRARPGRRRAAARRPGRRRRGARGANGMHWQALADRLAERFPERWAEASGDAVRAELGARGVPSVVVVMDGTRARGCRAADVDKAASGT